RCALAGDELDAVTAPLALMKANGVPVTLDFSDAIGLAERLGKLCDHLRRNETRLALAHNTKHVRRAARGYRDCKTVGHPGTGVRIANVFETRLRRTLMHTKVGAAVDHIGWDEIGQILAPKILIFGAGLGRVLRQRLVYDMRRQLRIHHA